MKFNPDIHHRHSIRLKEYDYSQTGYYFINICTKNRECFLGNIINGKMKLSGIGNIVKNCWYEIPKHFDNILLDIFVIMPDHLHGIVIIDAQCSRGGVTPPLQKYTLGQIVAYLKYQSTKLTNQIRKLPGTSIWQRNYFEHIIRNEIELNKLREYIINNPIKWEFDLNTKPDC